MDYKIKIEITNVRGDELAKKSYKFSSLDSILDVDLAELYAIAQQKEIESGLDIPEVDEYSM